MDKYAISIENLHKMYRLGTIGGGTLRGDIQSWWARIRGKDDPNLKIGGRTVYKKNETFMALNGIDLKIRKGEALGIIGANGAGKSTLLKILSRVTAPSDGVIKINGRISSMLEVGTGFNPELTGRENIYLNGAILGMTNAEIAGKIAQIIEFSECEKFIDTPVKRYSSGMYVKLAFSVAAHLDSEILVMDEVLAVGDMKFQQKCLGRMGDAADIEGRTVLYVSHNMHTIRQLCTRCVVLANGRVVFEGDVEQAIEVYLDTYGGREASSKSTDLSILPRDSEFQNGKAKMTAFTFAERDNGVFITDEKLLGNLDFSIEDDEEDVRLRIIVKTAEGQPVTMLLTQNGFEAKAGRVNTISFEADISKLAHGHYALSPVLYKVNEYGKNLYLDGLKNVVRIIVESGVPTAGEMEWKSNYWGHVRSEPIRLLNY